MAIANLCLAKVLDYLRLTQIGNWQAKIGNASVACASVTDMAKYLQHDNDQTFRPNSARLC